MSWSSYLQVTLRAYLYASLIVGMLEAKKTTWLPALLGRARARRFTSHVGLVIAKVLLLSPWFMLIVWLDENVLRLPVVFPRTRSEIMQRQSFFFKWLQSSAAWRGSKQSPTTSTATALLAASSNTFQLISIQDHNILEHEPDKNVDTCLLDVTCIQNEQEHVVQLFVKFSCGRNFPMFLQGVRCATEWGLQRELDFFKSIGRLQHVLPCPTSVALGGNFAANRLCLALDYVHGIVTPDHTGANAYQALSVVKTVANMHGSFWGMNVEQQATATQVLGNARAVTHGSDNSTTKQTKTRTRPRQTRQDDSDWISNEIVSFLDKMNARCGLEYFSFIRPCLDKKEEPIEFVKLWDGIEQWFAAQNITTTVVHGDCRLGNMMFVPKDDDDGDEKKKQDPTTAGQILFTDFEAVNVAPYLWDVVYFTVLCQTPEARRERHALLLQEYLDSLHRTIESTMQHRAVFGGLVVNDAQQMPPTTTTSVELNRLYDVLSLVLFFYSYTVERSGMWAGNGNSMADLKNWTRRVDERIQELDLTEMSTVLQVDIKWLEKVQNLVWDEPAEGSMSKKTK